MHFALCTRINRRCTFTQYVSLALHDLQMSESANSPDDDVCVVIGRGLEAYATAMGWSLSWEPSPRHRICYPIEVHGCDRLVCDLEVFLSAHPTIEELSRLELNLQDDVGSDVSVSILRPREAPNAKKRGRDTDEVKADNVWEVPSDVVSKEDEKKSKTFWFGSYASESTPPLSDVLKPVFSAFAAQYEMGEENGFRHVQFTGKVDKRCTLVQLRSKLLEQGAKLPIYLKPVEKPRLLAPKGCVAYCTKEDTRVPGTQPLVVGMTAKDLKGDQGKRSDLELVNAAMLAFPKNMPLLRKLRELDTKFPSAMMRYGHGIEKVLTRAHHDRPFRKPPGDPFPWQAAMLEKLHGEKEHRLIYWIWDSTGNVGKSCLVTHARAQGLHCLVVSEGLARDINLLFDYQDVVFYDVPRSMPSSQLEEWFLTCEGFKNGEVLSSKYLSVTKSFDDSPHLVFLANVPPPEQRRGFSGDRTVVLDLNHLPVFTL